MYERVENGWVQARIEELPGVITVAPTVEEAKEWLVDALQEYLLSLQSPARMAPAPPAVRSTLEITISAA